MRSPFHDSVIDGYWPGKRKNDTQDLEPERDGAKSPSQSGLFLEFQAGFINAAPQKVRERAAERHAERDPRGVLDTEKIKRWMKEKEYTNPALAAELK